MARVPSRIGRPFRRRSTLFFAARIGTDRTPSCVGPTVAAHGFAPSIQSGSTILLIMPICYYEHHHRVLGKAESTTVLIRSHSGSARHKCCVGAGGDNVCRHSHTSHALFAATLVRLSPGALGIDLACSRL